MEPVTLLDALSELSAVAHVPSRDPMASDLVNAAMDIGEARRNGWMTEARVRFRAYRCPPSTLATAMGSAEERGWDVDGLEIAEFDMGGRMVRVLVSEDADPELHGMCLSTDKGKMTFGPTEMMRCEALLSALQDHVAFHILCGSPEFRRVGAFMSATGERARISSPKTFQSTFGLRKGRYDPLLSAMTALCRSTGLRRDVPADMRPYCDLRKVTAATTALRSMVDGTIFEIAEADARMPLGTVVGFADSIGSLFRSGLAIPPPAGFGLGLRIRRFSGASYRAQYHWGLREIVLGVGDTGLFVHEYGHAMDHFLGRPSSGEGFRPVLEHYSRLVRESIPDGSGLGYYLSPKEVFARSYEMFVHGITGPSPVCRDLSGSLVHPDSPGLDREIAGYFAGILGTSHPA